MTDEVNKNINNLNKKELTDLLKLLTKYSDYINIFGKDASGKFWENYLNKKILIVEYYPSADLDNLKSNLPNIYKKYFDLDLNSSNIDISSIKFVENESLQGGIRVFLNDDMIDISFLNIHKQLV